MQNKDGALKEAPSIPPQSGNLSSLAVASAVILMADTLYTAGVARTAAAGEGVGGAWLEILIWLAILLALVLFWPAARSVIFWQRKNEAIRQNDIVRTRIAAAAARDWGFITLGYAAAGFIGLCLVQFVLANDMSVGRTFIYLPLMIDKYGLVLHAFWTNIFIFVVAEILVLVWGLVVAIARLLPGEAGRPIRMAAALYCDVFRGLPAVVTLYLIGFGLPLSGVIPSSIPGIGKIPLTWYAIIALVLTYGAYVAEVYRAGIESIHWSQIAAARSLGLSFFQALRHVIVPQAVRRIMAPLLNDFIGLQKDTALVNVIGVIDGFNQARIIASNAFNLSAVTVLAIIFVVITIPQARFVDKLLERDQRRMRAAG